MQKQEECTKLSMANIETAARLSQVSDRLSETSSKLERCEALLQDREDELSGQRDQWNTQQAELRRLQDVENELRSLLSDKEGQIVAFASQQDAWTSELQHAKETEDRLQREKDTLGERLATTAGELAAQVRGNERVSLQLEQARTEVEGFKRKEADWLQVRVHLCSCVRVCVCVFR